MQEKELEVKDGKVVVQSKCQQGWIKLGLFAGVSLVGTFSLSEEPIGGENGAN